MPEVNPATFLSRLLAIQVGRGLLDHELAELIDCSLRQLQRWRAGEAVPNWSTVVRIARNLDVPPAELAGIALAT